MTGGSRKPTTLGQIHLHVLRIYQVTKNDGFTETGGVERLLYSQ